MSQEPGVIAGNNPENPAQSIVLFYGRHPVFSNFYISSFKIGKTKFNCTEQYFQHKKALFFNDHKMADKILRTKSPSQQKKLGRHVKCYNENRWREVRSNVMEMGCLAKFLQNRDAKDRLLLTGDNRLAECSPTDKIWAIGLALADTNALNPMKWCGLNLMGAVLENVRELIRSEDDLGEAI